MEYTFEASTLEDTARLAAALAALAVPGTVIALDGDLGAGKTAFSQLYAAGLGVREVVNSPTFTIIKEYEGARMPFYHMDVYRLSLEESDELGLDEYFFGEGVTIVEWASKIEPLLPTQRLAIYIETTGLLARRMRLRASGEPYAAWCEELRANGLLRAGYTVR